MAGESADLCRRSGHRRRRRGVLVERDLRSPSHVYLRGAHLRQHGGGAGTVESNLEFQLIIMDTTHPPWKKSTIYQIGDLVRNKGSVTEPHRIYECEDAGTSASSGRGPSGTVGAIVDGGVAVGLRCETCRSPRFRRCASGATTRRIRLRARPSTCTFDVRASAAELLGIGSRTLVLLCAVHAWQRHHHHTASIEGFRMQYVIEEAQVTSARTG